ncbi:MAG: DeoR family transcriptional regulator, partial [Candidatus Pacebacteria bacterium]|nr:DeoR family transcriptional regulator [Candidatus Paceibacterota bacterium]
MFNPNFTITNNLLTYIANIEAARAVIENSPLVPAWEAKFRDQALTRTVHFGTKIEGNDLTQEQAQQVLRVGGADSKEVAKKAGIIARERDVQEVINYRNVINWIDQQDLAHTQKLFSLDTLKLLHSISMQKLLTDEETGQWRKKQVIVRGAADGQVVFRPPVSVEVPFLLKEFLTWLNSETTQQIHAIFRAAITHYQLVYIHPFVEGNGRTARAMATLVLYQAEYDFKRFFSLEQYFDNDVAAYYQALLSVQQAAKQDMTYWLEYFCYGLALEIDKIKQQVLKLSKDLKLKKELGEQVALSERQIILLELLQNQGEITSQEAQKAVPNVSVDTILRDLKDLIKKGVVKKHGVTKGVTYR